MSVSVDGCIADREGAFGWSAPSEELFRFHLAEVGELGGYLCGRRLYETMLVWETARSTDVTVVEYPGGPLRAPVRAPSLRVSDARPLRDAAGGTADDHGCDDHGKPDAGRVERGDVDL